MTITTTRRGWRRARRRAQPATGAELDTAGDTDEPTEDTDATSQDADKPSQISDETSQSPDEAGNVTEASLISTGFASLGIDPRLDAALALAELVEPTPIQAGAIPAGLEGRDVAGCARTGSGKTLAFGLVMISRLSGASSKAGRPRGLVLVPTRELAAQVTGVLVPLARAMGVKVAAVYGGADRQAQIVELQGGVDIIVATPLRLADLVRTKDCMLDAIEIACVDEADRMADQGFLPQVEWLLRLCTREHQTLAFSATLDGAIMVLRDHWMRDAVDIGVDTPMQTVDTMQHLFLSVHEMDRHRVVAALREGAGRTLVFCNTKRGADQLVRKLNADGCAAQAIHGDLTQPQRDRALHKFRTEGHAVLVATDVAARGIDVDDVDIVVHFDMPVDHKAYLHRSGRTARAGRDGTSVVFVMWNEQVQAAVLQKRLRLQLPVIEVFSNDARLLDAVNFAKGCASGDIPPAVKRS
jgi:superfamily II DNA/RNA helicase